MLEDKFVSVIYIITQYRKQETKTLVLVVGAEVAAPTVYVCFCTDAIPFWLREYSGWRVHIINTNLCTIKKP